MVLLQMKEFESHGKLNEDSKIGENKKENERYF